MGSETPFDPSILNMLQRAEREGKKSSVDGVDSLLPAVDRSPNSDPVIEALIQSPECVSALGSVHAAQRDLGMALNRATGQEIAQVVSMMQQTMNVIANDPPLSPGVFGALNINPEWTLPRHRLTRGTGHNQLSPSRITSLQGYGDTQRRVALSNGTTINWQVVSPTFQEPSDKFSLGGEIQRVVDGKEAAAYTIEPAPLTDQVNRSFIIGELTAEISIQAINAVLKQDSNTLIQLERSIREVRAKVTSVPVAETKPAPPPEAQSETPVPVVAITEAAQPSLELQFKCSDPRIAVAVNTVNEFAKDSGLYQAAELLQEFLSGAGEYQLGLAVKALSRLNFYEVVRNDIDSIQKRKNIKNQVEDSLRRSVDAITNPGQDPSPLRATAGILADLFMAEMIIDQTTQFQMDGLLKNTPWERAGLFDAQFPVTDLLNDLAQAIFTRDNGVSFHTAQKQNHQDTLKKINIITQGLLLKYGTIHDQVANAVADTSPDRRTGGGGTGGVARMMRY